MAPPENASSSGSGRRGRRAGWGSSTPTAAGVSDRYPYSTRPLRQSQHLFVSLGKDSCNVQRLPATSARRRPTGVTAHWPSGRCGLGGSPADRSSLDRGRRSASESRLRLRRLCRTRRERFRSTPGAGGDRRCRGERLRSTVEACQRGEGRRSRNRWTMDSGPGSSPGPAPGSGSGTCLRGNETHTVRLQDAATRRWDRCPGSAVRRRRDIASAVEQVPRRSRRRCGRMVRCASSRCPL